MEIVSQIRALVNRREGLLREAESIEQQIAEIRAALGLMDGGRPPRIDRAPTPPVRSPRPVALGGLSQERICAALERQEPQSTQMLIRLFPTMTTLPGHLPAMAKAGVLCRRRKRDGGNVYWYARSAAAFEGHPDFDETVAGVAVTNDPFRPERQGMGHGGAGVSADGAVQPHDPDSGPASGDGLHD